MNLSPTRDNRDYTLSQFPVPDASPIPYSSELSLTRIESNFSAFSSSSRTNLMEDISGHTGENQRRFVRSSSGVDHGGGWLKDAFQGWQMIILGSWLNLLFIAVPAAWTIAITMEEYHGLVFIFCILALIPLVKIHEVTTHELAVRIGGNKTGLVNASVSNIVEIVVAFSALRKCELRVVQSSLIGSILSKLLLILGLCFLAGGMRFSEQGFDATANRVNSSLLTISVAVLLLPAAYHFALSGNADGLMPEWQKENILRMSRGVSIILVFVYGLYLIFQLVSHSHLYKDTDEKSRRLSLKVPLPRSSSLFQLDKERLSKKNVSSSSLTSSESKNGRDNTLGKWFKGLSSTSLSSSPSRSLSPSRAPSPQTTPNNGGVRPLYLGRTLAVDPFAVSDPNSSQATLTNPQASYVPEDVGPTIRHVETPAQMPRGDSTSSFGHNRSSPTPSRDFRGPTINNHYHPGLTVDLTDEKNTKAHFGDIEQQNEPVSPRDNLHPQQEPRMSWFLITVSLIFATGAVAVTADWLVESMDGISKTVHKSWVALILLPAVSSLAECSTAIGSSMKDRITLSISVAVGSSIQTALFVIPLMIQLGWIMGKPLSLLFDPFDAIVLYISVQTMSHVVSDGRSNWLEGAILICLYIIIAVAFWFYPPSLLPTSLAVCNAFP
ncbi:sodium calcium [Moniliophthora roreri MCA 2997]|uniref:Sodium calcium n=1 Tax=Moniliophthora roreri (strain MCA 2997) TaxID=1381753 RepID=V2XQ97_MONRO|nr:sodium calcium [Moniliophthora roreri MCA 2997]